MFMDSTNENKMSQKCCSVFKKLCSMKVKDDLDLKMSVISDDGSVCFDKQIKSSGSFELMKTVAALAAIVLIMSAACSLCRCIKKN